MKKFTTKTLNLLSISFLSFIFSYPISVYGLTKEQEAFAYGTGFGMAGVVCELVSYEKISLDVALELRRNFLLHGMNNRKKGKVILGWNNVLKDFNDPKCKDLIW